MGVHCERAELRERNCPQVIFLKGGAGDDRCVLGARSGRWAPSSPRRASSRSMCDGSQLSSPRGRPRSGARCSRRPERCATRDSARRRGSTEMKHPGLLSSPLLGAPLLSSQPSAGRGSSRRRVSLRADVTRGRAGSKETSRLPSHLPYSQKRPAALRSELIENSSTNEADHSCPVGSAMHGD